MSFSDSCRAILQTINVNHEISNYVGGAEMEYLVEAITLAHLEAVRAALLQELNMLNVKGNPKNVQEWVAHRIKELEANND